MTTWLTWLLFQGGVTTGVWGVGTTTIRIQGPGLNYLTVWVKTTIFGVLTAVGGVVPPVEMLRPTFWLNLLPLDLGSMVALYSDWE